MVSILEDCVQPFTFFHLMLGWRSCCYFLSFVDDRGQEITDSSGILCNKFLRNCSSDCCLEEDNFSTVIITSFSSF